MTISVHRGQLGVWFTEELKMARAQGRVRGVSGPEALRSSLIRLKSKFNQAIHLSSHLLVSFRSSREMHILRLWSIQAANENQYAAGKKVSGFY